MIRLNWQINEGENQKEVFKLSVNQINYFLRTTPLRLSERKRILGIDLLLSKQKIKGKEANKLNNENIRKDQEYRQCHSYISMHRILLWKK